MICGIIDGIASEANVRDNVSAVGMPRRLRLPYASPDPLASIRLSDPMDRGSAPIPLSRAWGRVGDPFGKTLP